MRDLAGPRGDGLDVVVAYADHTISHPGADVERHRDAFAALEDIGVTWVTVSVSGDPSSSGTDKPAAARAFIEEFGANYAGEM